MGGGMKMLDLFGVRRQRGVLRDSARFSDQSVCVAPAAAGGLDGNDAWRRGRFSLLRPGLFCYILGAMPIYEFACSKCHHEFETLIRSSEKNRVQCPQCGSRKAGRKYSVFASSGRSNSQDPPACTSNPRSCGRCGTGVTHSH